MSNNPNEFYRGDRSDDQRFQQQLLYQQQLHQQQRQQQQSSLDAFQMHQQQQVQLAYVQRQLQQQQQLQQLTQQSQTMPPSLHSFPSSSSSSSAPAPSFIPPPISQVQPHYHQNQPSAAQLDAIQQHMQIYQQQYLQQQQHQMQHNSPAQSFSHPHQSPVHPPPQSQSQPQLQSQLQPKPQPKIQSQPQLQPQPQSPTQPSRTHVHPKQQAQQHHFQLRQSPPSHNHPHSYQQPSQAPLVSPQQQQQLSSPSLGATQLAPQKSQPLAEAISSLSSLGVQMVFSSNLTTPQPPPVGGTPLIFDNPRQRPVSPSSSPSSLTCHSSSSQQTRQNTSSSQPSQSTYQGSGSSPESSPEREDSQETLPQPPQSQPLQPSQTSHFLQSSELSQSSLSPALAQAQPPLRQYPSSLHSSQLPRGLTQQGATYSIDDEAVVHTIWGVAESLVSDNRVPEAIFTLHALCAQPSASNPSPTKQHTSSPSSRLRTIKLQALNEIRTRLRLSELLLLYTENREEAKQHIEKAQKLVELQSSVSLDLKLQVLLQSVRIYEEMKEGGNPTALERFYQFCQRGIRLSENSEASRWYWQFKMQRLSVLCQEGNSKLAWEELNDESSLKMLGLSEPLIKVLVDLVRSQILMLLPLPDFLKPAVLIQECDVELNRIQQSSPESPDVLHLRMHAAILQILSRLLTGEFSSAVGTEYAEVHELDRRVRAFLVNNPNSKTLIYRWMPSTCFFPLICLLSGIGLRITGALEFAHKYFGKGLEIVNDSLTKLIGVPKDKSYVIGKFNLKDVYSLVKIKFLLLENHVSLLLTKSELSSAIRVIQEMVDLFDVFQVALEKKRYVILVLLSHYSQSLGFVDFAIRHLEEAVKCAPKLEFIVICDLFRCILYLRDEKMELALNVLATYRTSIEKSQNRVVRSLFDYVQGWVLHVQSRGNLLSGKSTEAMQRLQHALETSNTSGNVQLMCHTLNSLTAFYLSPPDFERASVMLGPSFEMSNKLGDLTTMILTGLVLAELYRLVNLPQSVEKVMSSLAKDTTEFLSRVNEAKGMKETHLISTFLRQTKQAALTAAPPTPPVGMKTNKQQNQGLNRVQTAIVTNL